MSGADSIGVEMLKRNEHGLLRVRINDRAYVKDSSQRVYDGTMIAPRAGDIVFVGLSKNGYNVVHFELAGRIS